MHARIEAPVERGGWDAVVIGSGFGGTMAARELVRAGWRVLMLERGDWVARGPHNWAPRSVGPLTDAYSTATPYRVLAGGDREWMGAFECVGGPSVFYGGVSLRFRERDFEPAPEIVGDSGARWPFGYRELEPYYARAERLLGVAGDDGGDPTAPRAQRRLPAPAGGAHAHLAADLGSRAPAGPRAVSASARAQPRARGRPPALRRLRDLRPLRLRDLGEERPGHGGAPGADRARARPPATDGGRPAARERKARVRGRVRRPRQRPPHELRGAPLRAGRRARSPRRTSCWPRSSTA